MSRKTSRDEYRLSQTVIAVIYFLLFGLLSLAAAAEEGGDRTSLTRQFATGGRDHTGAPVETEDRHRSLVVDGKRTRTSIASGKLDSGVQGVQSGSNEFWFYAVDLVLFGDDDHDGYFFGIDLLFDADTIWSSADVYAVLYLSLDGGPWNEYAVTSDFLIGGATGDDEYVVVTELQSGYPTGSYDVLIELFDSATGEYLAGIGPEETSELGYLTLEDMQLDAPVIVRPVAVSHGHGGGGAVGIGLIALSGFALALRRRSRSRR
ncbi:MAG: choice-of-anchor H family protein [Gammaproteobacteria bacterium]|nr:choice-of-anchor H family protein [Gammaproteobacteria bacterium]MDH4255786.1 choice-of-anchor H family protein [Gammaproteobacteria bacterium]MDH5311639.1 choice-of-anchor H family protein [Gammaproteobacteria bacterium]